MIFERNRKKTLHGGHLPRICLWLYSLICFVDSILSNQTIMDVEKKENKLKMRIRIRITIEIKWKKERISNLRYEIRFLVATQMTWWTSGKDSHIIYLSANRKKFHSLIWLMVETPGWFSMDYITSEWAYTQTHVVHYMLYC